MMLWLFVCFFFFFCVYSVFPSVCVCEHMWSFLQVTTPWLVASGEPSLLKPADLHHGLFTLISEHVASTRRSCHVCCDYFNVSTFFAFSYLWKEPVPFILNNSKLICFIGGCWSVNLFYVETVFSCFKFGMKVSQMSFIWFVFSVRCDLGQIDISVRCFRTCSPPKPNKLLHLYKTVLMLALTVSGESEEDILCCV